MPPLSDPSYDSVKSLQTFSRLSSIATGTLIAPPLRFNDVCRLISVEDDETVEPIDEDPLAELLVNAAEALSSTHRVGNSEVDVDPTGSLASLFDKSSDFAKSLRPRLILAYDLQKKAEICGFCSVCDWTVDDALSTKKLTVSYCRDKGIPRFTGNDTLLIDVISSSKQQAGALMVLSAYLMMARSKKHKYLTCVAVSPQGKSLFEKMGFSSHSFKEGTQRTFFWIQAGDMQAEDIHKRLRWDNAVQSVCWRRALTPKAKNSLLTRC